jgi:hypothetical protein
MRACWLLLRKEGVRISMLGDESKAVADRSAKEKHRKLCELTREKMEEAERNHLQQFTQGTLKKNFLPYMATDLLWMKKTIKNKTDI